MDDEDNTDERALMLSALSVKNATIGPDSIYTMIRIVWFRWMFFGGDSRGFVNGGYFFKTTSYTN
jgi:hypothetical protein